MAEEARHLNGAAEAPSRSPAAPLHIVAPPTISDRMRERIRVSEIGRAQALADPRGTVWSRFGLLDTLETPQPMTWSLLRRMMSGRGAFGHLFRKLGFEPEPALDNLGVLDLICGRPYYNLSRLARMYSCGMPFRHRIEGIRAEPRRAVYPSPHIDFRAASPWLWRHLPRTFWRMLGARRRLDRWRRTLGEPTVMGIAPMFVAEVRRALDEDLGTMDAVALLTRYRAWVRRVVDEFATEVLRILVVAAYASSLVEKRHGIDEAERMLAGVRPRAEGDMEGLLDRGAWTPWPFESLLDAVGHRGSLEMELATPRWSEVPERLWQELERRRALEPPRAEHLPATRDDDILMARAWIALRETSQHWLMFGWSELRRILLMLDRRLRLDGGVFWLTLDELGPAVESGVRRDLLDERIERHRLMAGISSPRVLFSDDLDALGRA